jgi:hypothetical protein
VKKSPTKQQMLCRAARGWVQEKVKGKEKHWNRQQDSPVLSDVAKREAAEQGKNDDNRHCEPKKLAWRGHDTGDDTRVEYPGELGERMYGL